MPARRLARGTAPRDIDQPIYTTGDLAYVFCCAANTITAKINQGLIPASKLPGTAGHPEYRISHRTLAKLIEAGNWPWPWEFRDWEVLLYSRSEALEGRFAAYFRPAYCFEAVRTLTDLAARVVTTPPKLVYLDACATDFALMVDEARAVQSRLEERGRVCLVLAEGDAAPEGVQAVGRDRHPLEPYRGTAWAVAAFPDLLEAIS